MHLVLYTKPSTPEALKAYYSFLTCKEPSSSFKVFKAFNITFDILFNNYHSLVEPSIGLGMGFFMLNCMKSKRCDI